MAKGCHTRHGEIYPSRYVPTSLRRPIKPKRICEMFAVGYGQEGAELRMVAGPMPDISDMLEFVPVPGLKDFAFIVRFNPDRTATILFRWEDGGWNNISGE